jgi:molybdopterin/thiamine biosynthesis adenylyltransferase/nitroreductase
MGGVGGAHALALARSGIGNFHMADFDIYEVGNFNRQVGAMMSTVGREKVKVMAEMVADINPTANLKLFEQGITEENVDEFLKDVDVAIDGIDFFAPRARRMLFAAARRLGIPCVTAGPIGLGTSVMVFSPTGMSYDEYTGITDASDDVEMCVRFMVALLPKVLHEDSVPEPWRLNLALKIAPSHAAGINMAAGACATEVAKIVTGRGKLVIAPDVWQADAFTSRAKLTRGNGFGKAWFRNLRVNIVLKRIRAVLPLSQALLPPSDDTDDLTYILEAGRWAPSLNNRQGWRFTRLSPTSLRIAIALPDDQVARARGSAAVLQELGGLLEVMRIAAAERLRRPWYLVQPLTEEATEPIATVRFRPASRTAGAPEGFATLPEESEDSDLKNYLRRRHTNRGPYLRDAVFPDVLADATEAAGQLGVELTVHEGRPAVGAMAKANATAAKLQRALDDETPADLVSDELFPAHGLAKKGLGSSAADKACAAHLTLSLAQDVAWTANAVVRGGAALARVWLVFTRHWVEVQPSMAAVAYAWAHSDGAPLVKEAAAARLLPTISSSLSQAWGSDGPSADRALVTLRVGRVKKDPVTREVRLALDDLMVEQGE